MTIPEKDLAQLYGALQELALIDGLFNCLVAQTQRLQAVEVVVVMPGVHEIDRVRGAMLYAHSHGARRFICTGTNAEERALGEVYNEARIRGLTKGRLLSETTFQIEVDEVGNHTRMQGMNAAKRLAQNPPTGIVVQTGGSWHTPRSYLAFLQACKESFAEADKPMPVIYPLLVDVGFGGQIKADSVAHKLSGYNSGIIQSITAEIDRRLQYTPIGHLMNLSDLQAYLSTTMGM